MLASLLSVAAVSAATPLPAIYAWQRAVAGAGAYCAATLVTSPMDVVKVRQQLCGAKDTSSPSSLRLALSLLTKEGVLVFFSGIGPALLMAPAAAAQYTLMEPLNAHMPLFAAALIAGAIDITIKCPFDRVKTHRQGMRSTCSTGRKNTFEFLAHEVRECVCLRRMSAPKPFAIGNLSPTHTRSRTPTPAVVTCA